MYKIYLVNSHFSDHKHYIRCSVRCLAFEIEKQYALCTRPALEFQVCDVEHIYYEIAEISIPCNHECSISMWSGDFAQNLKNNAISLLIVLENFKDLKCLP